MESKGVEKPKKTKNRKKLTNLAEEMDVKDCAKAKLKEIRNK